MSKSPRDNDKAINKRQAEIYEAVQKGDLEQVINLINTGIDLEKRDKDGYTLLKVAVDFGYLEIVQGLLKAGASTIFPEGRLLSSAIKPGKIEILEELIKAGVDINQRLEDDKTILMEAANIGDINVVKKLVESGADVNALTDGGDFALLNAAYQGWQEVFDYLAPLTSLELRQESEQALPKGLVRRKRANDKYTEDFIDAVAIGDLNTVVQTIKNGVDVNAISSEGTIPLHTASFWGYLPIVRVLLEAGANLESRTEDDGKTPLMSSAEGSALLATYPSSIDRMNQIEVIRLLINAGADVNAKSNEGWTALIAAANSGCVEAVKLLLQAGADAKAKDCWGDTALSRALAAGYVDIVQLLQQAGAEEN
ncbi:ankyrin repeat domain-containing protein [Trichormus variabilis]|uniref:Uncharacterized protein n=1 Tax=Trichormus variabilis NIES-23 TaxID=1973479 RepID=A0A1Z4KX76_ANAVA|nr:ankyrin repeat domain-containing protein [Trichormus variabilis]MBD2348357.1 ankyrin repeat domain-containing protein [Trichormus variabilis FACHB-171]MBD2351206.1 ankyrin repeat domain-containing protein [Trichormus variabilis FACHB-171]BAY73557.1 hypothetical protein NIES23_64090 [Trichormus variabilis NIES-23]